MLLNFAVSLLVNQFTEEPPEEVQEIVENIRIPSGAGEAVSHLIIFSWLLKRCGV